MDYVYCLLVGDCIECGCNLESIYATQTGTLTAAMHYIEDRENHWVNKSDFANWQYVEDIKERTDRIIYYARIRKGYDIVMVAKEPVQID